MAKPRITLTTPYDSPGTLHGVSKNCAKLFLSELRQIYTNFDNFRQKDDKEAKIIYIYIFIRHEVSTRKKKNMKA